MNSLTEAQIKWAFNVWNSSYSLREIAEALGVGQSTLQRALCRRGLYKDPEKLVYKEERIP